MRKCGIQAKEKSHQLADNVLSSFWISHLTVAAAAATYPSQEPSEMITHSLPSTVISFMSSRYFCFFFLFIRTCTCITKTMPASSSNNNERRPHPRNPACPRLICLVFIFPHVGCVRKLLSLAINLASPRTYRTTEKVSFFIVNDYNNNDGKSYYAPAAHRAPLFIFITFSLALANRALRSKSLKTHTINELGMSWRVAGYGYRRLGTERKRSKLRDKTHFAEQIWWTYWTGICCAT